MQVGARLYESYQATPSTRVRAVPVADSLDMSKRENRESGRGEKNDRRKENKGTDPGKKKAIRREGERSENETKAGLASGRKKLKGEGAKTEQRETLVALGRTNIKPENEQRPKLRMGEKEMKKEDKDLDLVVRRIKNREQERRSGKDARRASLDETGGSGGSPGFNSSSRASLAAVRFPEAQSSKAEQSKQRGPDTSRTLPQPLDQLSRRQERTLAKMKRGPPMVNPAPTRVKETRPKGKTIRKAHYDPHEVSDEKANEILARRLQNDSKCGGRSKSRIVSKKSPRLGSDRGRLRLDRIYSYDEDEDGPRYEEDW